MALMDYFKPVTSWSTEQVRMFLQDRRPGEYNLIDVRQPGEYEKEHLPGALLIPMSELPEKMKELDPDKQTIAY